MRISRQQSLEMQNDCMHPLVVGWVAAEAPGVKVHRCVCGLLLRVIPHSSAAGSKYTRHSSMTLVGTPQ